VNLAYTYRLAGRTDEAIPLYELTAHVAKRTLGSGHWITRDTVLVVRRLRKR
jgi:hypothetical protein